MFFLQIMALLFLVLENLLLECCVVHFGYGFGGTALSKALSGLGATATVAPRLAGALLWNKMNEVDVHSIWEPYSGAYLGLLNCGC